MEAQGGALPTIEWLTLAAGGTTFDHHTGVVLTGHFTVTASQSAAVGFALGSAANTTVILMDAAGPDSQGQTVVGDIDGAGFSLRDVSGSFVCGAHGAICDDATLTSATPDRTHSFILLVRRGMFELYVDEMLVQTFTYGTYPVTTGRIGVAVNGTAGGGARFEGVAAAAWS